MEDPVDHEDAVLSRVTGLSLSGALENHATVVFLPGLAQVGWRRKGSDTHASNLINALGRRCYRSQSHLYLYCPRSLRPRARRPS